MQKFELLYAITIDGISMMALGVCLLLQLFMHVLHEVHDVELTKL
jgi:hypothetical protein